MRTTVFAVALSAALLLIASPAVAAEETDPPVIAASDEGYVPTDPDDPSIAGSAVWSTCVQDAPWINFSVTLDDPDGAAAGHTATLELSGSGESTTIELGELVDGALQGSVLWPGASVGADGAGTGWPGWELRDGSWVATSGNFAWTRGAVSAVLHVNPSMTVALSYPEATAACTAAPASAGAVTALTDTATADAALSDTGLAAPVVPILVGGGLLALAGVGLLAVRRRRT